MNEKEFLELIKENKYFEDYKENALYRFPAVKYFLENKFNMFVNGMPFKNLVREVLPPTTDEGYQYTCYLYLIIRMKYGYKD